MATSSASCVTQTTLITEDTASSLCGGDDSIACSISLNSRDSAHSSIPSFSMINGGSGTATINSLDNGMEMHRIYDYQRHDFYDYVHHNTDTCEDVCIAFAQYIKINPVTRLLFSLCVHDDPQAEWLAPSDRLATRTRYSFRMRFKVPSLDTQLQTLDPHAYVYLYHQMRYDMVNERITEIRYPAKKDNVMGLGVVDMYIDLLQNRDTLEHIEANYKRYLPRPLVRAHKMFVKPKIKNSFRQFRSKNFSLPYLHWSYVHQIHNLASDYLMEMFVAKIDYIPGEEKPIMLGANGNNDDDVRNKMEMQVFVRIDLQEDAQPTLKIARITTEENRKWTVVTSLENIYTVWVDQAMVARLEIIGFPQDYRMEFKTEIELKSFITYLAGYHRLTSKWMSDLCGVCLTPSLKELMLLRCHGPVGGNFSYAKLRESGASCGLYVLRECEREYGTYFIDINTAVIDKKRKLCKTETFKIKRDRINGTWILHQNENLRSFHDIDELAKHIPAQESRRKRIGPFKNEKPLNLLICLPKNLRAKKTDTELSESELLMRRPQLFEPTEDLLWYRETTKSCDDGKMQRMRADWKQVDTCKDVPVTLKVLNNNDDFVDFMKLSQTWSRICSPQIIKLYGLTLFTPYTMIMEWAEYGPLNKFLRHRHDISDHLLLEAVFGLVRGLAYLREKKIIHGFIRCSNLFVTKCNYKSNILQAKIGDPGLPRPYRDNELSWIPFEYHTNPNAAKKDMFADYWAFATTMWEIYSHGESPGQLTPQELRQNFNREGAILSKPKGCPSSLYATIMDGWSEDGESRFNHQNLFSRLTAVKESLASSYANPTTDSTSLDIDMDASDCEISPTEDHGHINNSYFNDTPSVLRIRDGKLIFKEKIGEGHYGTVFKGEICYTAPERPPEQVAIKTLKSSISNNMDQDFMREVKIMLELDHPNIVKIKLSVRNPIAIIMEYVEHGSFTLYLTTHKPNLTNEKLLQFALDIAKGMDYLRTKKVIHRDLAARNILIDRDQAKISDFGLAQFANNDGYYRCKSRRDIPIKWYSPESIKTEKFSFQSDVWSYGVTLFEMFSRGEIPNLVPGQPELPQQEFLERLLQGEQLKKHELCPETIYMRLMRPCWNLDPKSRPSFTDIIETVKSIRAENYD